MNDRHFGYITKLKKTKQKINKFKSFQNLGCCHKAGGGKVVGNEISTRVLVHKEEWASLGCKGLGCKP